MHDIVRGGLVSSPGKSYRSDFARPERAPSESAFGMQFAWAGDTVALWPSYLATNRPYTQYRLGRGTPGRSRCKRLVYNGNESGRSLPLGIPAFPLWAGNTAVGFGTILRGL